MSRWSRVRGHEDGPQGPAVAERRVARELAGRPADEAEHQQEVGVLLGHGPVADREIQDRFRRRVRRRQEPAGDATARLEDHAHQDRHDQRRGDCADEVGPPAAPADLRAEDPQRGAPQDRIWQEFGQPPVAEHPSSILDGPGDGQDEQHHQAQGEPALRRSSREEQAATLRDGVAAPGRRGHPSSASARGRRASTQFTLSSYSARA